mmetsp:Transcript_35816/g.72740  ORF Transcript_35816/g.72740 Transcript_35816/m.72740 type:complete len:298 (+) Transcript_35816:46-939(+)
MAEHVEDITNSRVEVQVSALSPRGVTIDQQKNQEQQQCDTAFSRGDLEEESGRSTSFANGTGGSSSSPTATANPTDRRPNASLTAAERREKTRLKRLLKLQSRIHKIEKRIRHARSRRDPTTEEQGKVDLINMVQKHEEGTRFVSDEFVHLFGGHGDEKSSCGSSCNDDAMKADVKHENGTTAGGTGSDARTSRDIENHVKQVVISVSNELFRHVYGESDGASETPSSTSNGGKNIGKGIKRKRRAEETNGDDITAVTSGRKVEAKEDQTKRAVKMLKAMTKGKQEEDMFHDSAALW